MAEYSAARRIWFGAGSGISTSRTVVLKGSVIIACRARTICGTSGTEVERQGVCWANCRLLSSHGQERTSFEPWFSLLPLFCRGSHSRPKDCPDETGVFHCCRFSCWIDTDHSSLRLANYPRPDAG